MTYPSKGPAGASRQGFLAAAQQLFGKYGRRKGTWGGIARRAHVSKATI